MTTVERLCLLTVLSLPGLALWTAGCCADCDSGGSSRASSSDLGPDAGSDGGEVQGDGGASDLAPLDAARLDLAPADAGQGVDGAQARDGGSGQDAQPADGEVVDGGDLGPVACLPPPDGGAAEVDGGAAEDAFAVGPGCRSDLFLVEVPLGEGLMLELLPDVAPFEAELDPLARAWICGPDAPGCLPPGEPAVRIVPVLVGMPGALRYWRVELPGPVRREALCDAVRTIRSLLEPVFAPARVFVARDCGVTAQGAEATPTPEMARWHLRRLFGADPPPDPGPVPDAARVEVALIDSGLPAALARSLGLQANEDVLAWRPEPGEASEPATVGQDEALHLHGSAMALLIRQVAPYSVLRSYRVLDQDGVGTTRDLARGLERALAAAANQPLVINLSLGWPPELGRARRLTGAEQCETTEDPVGEVVRYMLHELRAADRSGRVKVAVVASAGNRPGRPEFVEPMYSRLFHVQPGAQPAQPCPQPQQAPPGQDWFYPAEWGRRSSCSPRGEERWLAWGAAAINGRDRQAANQLRGYEAPLVAPGEHVYVDHDAVDPTEVETTCGPPEPPAGLTLPRALTGSSVAAALSSGALARAQEMRLRAGAEPLAAPALFALAYLSGAELLMPRTVHELEPELSVRQLSVCRLEQALGCDSLVACAERWQEARVTPQLLADCARPALQCLGRSACPAPVAARPAGPAGYSPSEVCDRTPPFCPGAAGPAAGCEATPEGCPYERVPDRHSLGYVGPHPGIGGCPDCSVLFSGAQAALLVELNSGFGGGTSFVDPHLILHRYNSPRTTFYLPLPVDPDNPWQPGGAYLVEGLDPPPGLAEVLAADDLASFEAELHLTVEQPVDGQPPAGDVSPLRLQVGP